MSTISQIRSFFSQRTEHILAAAAVGASVVSYYATKNIIAPGIVKIGTAAKPYFDKIKKFFEEHHKSIIKGVVSLGVVGLTAYSAFRIFTIAQEVRNAAFRISTTALELLPAAYLIGKEYEQFE